MTRVNLKIESLQNVITDKEDLFTIGYYPELDAYFLLNVVWWIMIYERWYLITKEDYELYKSDRKAFCEKFKKELSYDITLCLTERFAGAPCLRDYDGVKDFQYFHPSTDGNVFNGHLYKDGVFYARIKWDDLGEIYVPPIQAIKQEDGNFGFPLREKCDKVLLENRGTICYKLKTE